MTHRRSAFERELGRRGRVDTPQKAHSDMRIDEINQELERIGASTTGDTPGLDCDDITDGIATFSDSQETASVLAEAALVALRGVPDDAGFDAAWQALMRADRVSLSTDGRDPVRPITTSGWYVHTDGTVGRYVWGGNPHRQRIVDCRVRMPTPQEEDEDLADEHREIIAAARDAQLADETIATWRRLAEDGRRERQRGQTGGARMKPIIDPETETAETVDANKVRAVCEDVGYGFTIAFAAIMWGRKAVWGERGMATWLRSLADEIENGEAVEQRWFAAAMWARKQLGESEMVRERLRKQGRLLEEDAE